MAGLREFLQSGKGKQVAVGVVVVGVLLAIWSVWANLGPSAEVLSAIEPVYINAETWKQKNITMKVGTVIPAGWYQAELCYWTKDGTTKDTPTYVLLNKYKGKSEPTFCPDCGRLVVGRNPGPSAGMRP